MNEKNTKYLLKKYPGLYSNHKLPMTQTCMCWLFCTGDGWFKIIDELSAAIVKLDKNVKASQVKEKYGTLRFYTDGHTDEVDKLIDEAEAKSVVTCEVCGKPGKMRGKSWLSIRCDSCWKKENKK